MVQLHVLNGASAGEKFARGILLHDHDSIVQWGEKLQSGPVSLLWTT